MKKALLVLALVLIAISGFAQGDQILSQRQAIYEELRAHTYDNLVKSTYCALTSVQHVTPNDTTSTGTHSSSYLGTLKGPLLMRVQNLGTTGKIYFKEYALSGTNVASTTDTDPYLQSTHGNYLATGTAGQLAPGECWEKVYYGEPDLMFGGVEAATFSIQIFQRNN